MTVQLAKQVMAVHADGLTPSARALLRHLAVLAGPDGTVRWALSDAQLQRELGLGRTAVKSARRQLVDDGLADVVEAGSGRHATVYRVLAGTSSQALAAAAGDPQGVGTRPPGGRNPTPSTHETPPIRAGKVSTTYGLDEVPPVPQPAARAAPPPAPERVEERSIDEFAAALPAQLLPRSGFDRARMVRAVAPLLAAGWPPDELAAAVTRVAPLPYAVISGVGLLEARLRTVEREQPRARPAPAVPWCGACDEHNRQREGPDGWHRCPDCHPGVVRQSDGPRF